ncbi:MAG: xanthine-guanine phosphoribosyltransferase [Myxococcales bacterium]|nr:xanthine-guanine phosphoribosyltransferase [Myxococcales bacterium]
MTPPAPSPDKPPADVQFQSLPYRPCEIAHRYGDKVHILGDPLSLAMLARVCAKGTVQPEINRLVGELYRQLVHEVIATEFPRESMAVPTRMIDVTPRGVWRGDAIATSTPAVVVAVARAGLMPSQVTYDFLNQLLQPEGVRQDHLALARTVDDKGGVTGAGVYGSKIGGPVDGAMLLIPDPMGATGSTISKVIEQYGSDTYGHPGKIISVHLIITPEYLRYVTKKHPEVTVYALRLDRGLSAADVLQTTPGERWDEERGLTDKHYIVPGGGGLGEVMNNSFV